MSYAPPNRSFPHSSHTRVRNTENTADTRTNFPSAFQQGRREDSRNRTSMTQGPSYRSWKTNGTMEPEKPKPIQIDSTEDFPTLGGVREAPMTRSSMNKNGESLAQKLKESIELERDQATQRRYKKDNDRWDVISLPFASAASWSAKQQEKRNIVEDRRREADEEEQRYRWNVSNDMADNAEFHYEDEEKEEYPTEANE